MSPPDSKDNPICPVCLHEIKSKDRVSGFRDDLMHESCDYTRQRPPNPDSSR